MAETDPSRNSASPLEAKVEKVSSQKSTSTNVMLLPLEEYEKRFSKRYYAEKPFQEIVHTYLHLGKRKKLDLAISKRLFHKRYQRETGNLVKQYATKIRADLQKALDAKNAMEELKRQREESESAARKLEQARENYDYAQMEASRLESERRDKTAQVTQEIAQAYETTEREIEEKRQEVIAKTDVKAIVQKQIQSTVSRSSLLKADALGNFTFDDARVAQKLEDIFLDETLREIEDESGPGFMRKVRMEYEGIITHTDDMEDLSELPHVDWVESVIHSRTKGYKLPTFPYLRVEKSDGLQKVQTSVDSAISLDLSGSMREEHKFEMAQKATLSVHALMRRLNPHNNTYLSGFHCGRVYDLTTAELMRTVNPDGSTPTHLALEWLLDRLVPLKQISIAHLVTDGLPDSVEAATNVARKFREHPYIMLNIILVNGNDDAKNNIRMIGAAAGESTKVLFLDGYQLPGGLLKEVPDALSRAYKIGEI